MEKRLTIPELYEKFLTLVISDRDEQLEELRVQMENMLSILEEKQGQLIDSGIISKNGALDFPPEILVNIFESSQWMMELRKLNKYFFDVYNQYNKLEINIDRESNLKFVREISLRLKIKVINFIPDSIDGISELSIDHQGHNPTWFDYYIDLENFFKLVEELRSNETLKSLKVYRWGIGYEGVEKIADSLRTNKTLKSLNLVDCDVGSLGATFLADALRVNNSLLVLNLSTNNIESIGIIKLAQALEENITLETLVLQRIGINSTNVIYLAKALRKNNIIKDLDLSYNHIKDGVIEIANSLQENKSITELNLIENNIDDIGAVSLAKALRKNNTLEYLYLGDNNIGNDGVIKLSTIFLNNNILKHLDLTSNSFNQVGYDALKPYFNKISLNQFFTD